MTCQRKKMSEMQAPVVAQRMGARYGQRHYPTYCDECKAYHVTAYYSLIKKKAVINGKKTTGFIGSL